MAGENGHLERPASPIDINDEDVWLGDLELSWPYA